MSDQFRVVARRSYLDSGMPKVAREVIGLYPTRSEAEIACSEFLKSPAGSFRTAYDDCIVELVLGEQKLSLDASARPKRVREP
jgi:hypothetical protein